MEVEVPFGKTLDVIWHSLTKMVATPTSVSHSLEICHCCHRCPRSQPGATSQGPQIPPPYSRNLNLPRHKGDQ